MSGVKAVRGAITVDENSKKSILDATGELLGQLTKRNSISEDDIISVIFSMTEDLDASFPAEAARKMGWKNTPLMCTREIDVPGSLKKCIRVLMHFYSVKYKKDIEHVYLKGAKSLRKDLEVVRSIAIDGPAGAGKSTMAKILAKRLGYVYLDTGAMYRTVALKAIKEGIDTKQGKEIAVMVEYIDMDVVFKDGEQRMILDNKDVTGEIRSREVTTGSSDVAVVPEVRDKMVEMQRRIAKKKNIVMDGRDIGSHVLPDADFKFFLNASVEARAKRRYKEQKGKGIETFFNDVIEDIKYRDKNDSTREFSPLVKADDAIEIDSTNMGIEQVAQKLIGIVEGAV